MKGEESKRRRKQREVEERRGERDSNQEKLGTLRYFR